ncbi:Dipeptidyl-peptidase 5, partial [Tilletia horrida]
MLATIPDPFDQYGPPKQDDQILSILTPTSLLFSFTVLPSPSLGGGSSTPSAAGHAAGGAPSPMGRAAKALCTDSTCARHIKVQRALPGLVALPTHATPAHRVVSPNGLHALVGVSEHDLGSPAKVTTRKTIYHLGLPAHIAGRRSGSKDKDKDGPDDRILAPVDSEPQELISSVSVKASQPVIHGGVLITATSHYSTAELYWLAPTGGSKLVQLTTFGKDSAALNKVDFGPEPEEIQWAGAKGRTAHGWIVKPPGFKASKKYPLAVLIHGGPEGAWTNAWSVRWNPAVFAAAGFVVFTPNPAGSTSFGQDYQEEILGSWGEKPYLDIISGVHHVLRVVDGVDKERVVAAGASYGGFMINWLQGHNNDKPPASPLAPLAPRPSPLVAPRSSRLRPRPSSRLRRRPV